jgi:hypothetical protein
MSDFEWSGKTRSQIPFKGDRKTGIVLVLLAGVALYGTSWLPSGGSLQTVTQSEVLGSSDSLGDAISGTYSRDDAGKKADASKMQKAKFAPRKAPTSTPPKEPQSAAGFHGEFRSVCVRLCDGYYYPISHAVTPDLFWRDELACQGSCLSPARLFVSKSADDTMDGMYDLDGNAYSTLSTAFQYRAAFDPACTCKSAPWSEEAMDLHKLYALQAEQQKGNEQVAFQIDDLKDKVAAEQKQVRERIGTVAVAYVEPKVPDQGGKKGKRAKQAAAKAAQVRKAAATRAAQRVRQVQVRMPAPRGFATPVVVTRRGYVTAGARVRVTEARGLFR